MKAKSLLGLLILSVVAVGCRTGNSEADTQALKEEFGQANYEKAMKESGKGAELEAEKQKWAESGQSSGQGQ